MITIKKEKRRNEGRREGREGKEREGKGSEVG